MNNRSVGAMVKTKTFKTIAVAGTAFMVVACGLILFAGGAQGKGVPGTISATLEPRRIGLGDSALLTIHISGEQTGPPELSGVDGLRLYTAGKSSQYQSINGRISSVTSYLIHVQGERTGTFTIPPITARINGRVGKTGPINVQVLRTGGARASARAIPPSGMGVHARSSDSGKNRARPAFLRIMPSKARSFVGETVPVEVRAYFRQGIQATLNSLPVLSGDAFSCRPFSRKPKQEEKLVDGVPYTVLTWYTTLSAVKEGEYPVRAYIDATLLIPEMKKGRHSRFGRGIFDDDFFNSFFSHAREKEVKLKSLRLKMRVLPLPGHGRPANFGGAVGRFTLSATASPKSGMVGDPITLKTTIKGKGNFDRVSKPILSSCEGWKTYGPTTLFKPSDSAGLRGKKLFEQPIIPLDASKKEIPPIVFSYFDTKSEKYVTLRTKAIPVNIVPASTRVDAARQNRSEDNLANNGSASRPTESTGEGRERKGLAPIHLGLGAVVSDLRPILKKPWFVGAQGISLGVLFVGLFVGRRRSMVSNDPDILKRKQIRRKVVKSINEMDRAVREHDVPRFFNNCRIASQECLGEIWSMAPESITLADVKERLVKNGEGIRLVFETADAVAYSGRSFSQDELKEYRDLVKKEIKELRKQT